MTQKIKIEHHTLCLENKKIQLPHSEINILGLLLAHAGKVVEREALLKTGWPERVVSNNTLSVAIKSLRRKLQELGVENSITTVPSRGYYIDAEIIPVYFSLADGLEFEPESLSVIDLSSQQSRLGEADVNLNPQEQILSEQTGLNSEWSYKHIIYLTALLLLTLLLANNIYSPFSSTYFCDDSPDKPYCKLTGD